MYQIIPAVILDEADPSTDSNTHDFQLLGRVWIHSLSALATVSTVVSILVLKK